MGPGIPSGAVGPSGRLSGPPSSSLPHWDQRRGSASTSRAAPWGSGEAAKGALLPLSLLLS